MECWEVRLVASLTPLAVSALALLGERPMHPYEMYRLMIERQGDRVVKVRPGSLYHAVDRMAADGQVEATGTDRNGARPERTTYRITDEGRAAMQDWIRANLEEPVNEFPRFPVALAEMHNLPRAEAMMLLAARADRLERQLTAIESVLEGKQDRVAEAYLLYGHYYVEMVRAELGWLRRLVTRLESKELEWPLEDEL